MVYFLSQSKYDWLYLVTFTLHVNFMPCDMCSSYVIYLINTFRHFVHYDTIHNSSSYSRWRLWHNSIQDGFYHVILVLIKDGSAVPAYTCPGGQGLQSLQAHNCSKVWRYIVRTSIKNNNNLIINREFRRLTT